MYAHASHVKLIQVDPSVGDFRTNPHHFVQRPNEINHENFIYKLKILFTHTVYNIYLIKMLMNGVKQI